MSTVSVNLQPGLSSVQKAFIAKGVAEVVAEVAGMSREQVQVVINESPGTPDAGPAPARLDPPAFVNLRRQYIRADKHDDYLRWRRESVYPFMASHGGFISSLVLVSPDEPDQYLIVNKWASVESQDAYRANPREAQLKVEAQDFHTRRPTDDFNGHVVGVFHRHSAPAGPPHRK